MKPSKYMLSVQWGSGHHYFLGTTYTTKETVKTAQSVTQEELTTRSNRTSKRGARPTVYAWEQITREVSQEENPDDHT